MSAKRNSLYVGALLCLVTLTMAQDTLLLTDAVQRGLLQNYDIQLERQNVAVNEMNNTWGQAGRWPTITFDLVNSNRIADNVETATPFQLQDITKSYGVNPSINLNWMLFNGFKVNMNKRRFDQLEAESEGNASIVVANTIQGIVLGYFTVILQMDRLNELEQQLNLSRDRWTYVKVKSNFGGAGASDRLQEEVNYLTDSLSYVNQTLTVRNAMRNLNILMAEPNPDQEFMFPNKLDFENPEYDVNELREKMFQRNVDLQKQYLTQSILNTNVAIAQADRYPTLSMNGGVGQNNSWNDLSDARFPSGDGSSRPGPADPLTAMTRSASLTFSLSFNLYNGGRINRAIRAAKIQEDMGNIRLDKMRLSMERDLVQTLDQYNIRRQLYEINVRRGEVAQENLELSEQKFRNGTINSFDYRVVQNSYFSSSQLRLAALYSLIESHVSLMRLTGGLIATFEEEGQ